MLGLAQRRTMRVPRAGVAGQLFEGLREKTTTARGKDELDSGGRGKGGRAMFSTQRVTRTEVMAPDLYEETLERCLGFRTKTGAWAGDATRAEVERRRIDHSLTCSRGATQTHAHSTLPNYFSRAVVDMRGGSRGLVDGGHGRWRRHFEDTCRHCIGRAFLHETGLRHGCSSVLHHHF